MFDKFKKALGINKAGEPESPKGKTKPKATPKEPLVDKPKSTKPRKKPYIKCKSC